MPSSATPRIGLQIDFTEDKSALLSQAQKAGADFARNFQNAFNRETLKNPANIARLRSGFGTTRNELYGIRAQAQTNRRVIEASIASAVAGGAKAGDPALLKLQAQLLSIKSLENDIEKELLKLAKLGNEIPKLEQKIKNLREDSKTTAKDVAASVSTATKALLSDVGEAVNSVKRTINRADLTKIPISLDLSGIEEQDKRVKKRLASLKGLMTKYQNGSLAETPQKVKEVQAAIIQLEAVRRKLINERHNLEESHQRKLMQIEKAKIREEKEREREERRRNGGGFTPYGRGGLFKGTRFGHVNHLVTNVAQLTGTSLYGLGSVGALATLVTGSVKQAAEAEQSKTVIAGLLNTYTKFKEYNGQNVSLAENYVRAQTKSASVYKSLRKRADESILTTSELLDFYTAGQAAGGQSGFNTDQIMYVVERLGSLGKATGLQPKDTTQDIRSLLTRGAKLDGNNKTAGYLGLLTESGRKERNEALEKGPDAFIAFLKKKMAGIEPAMETFANSFTAKFSTFVDKMQQVGISFGEVFFPTIMPSLDIAIKDMKTFSESGAADDFAREISTITKAVAEGVGAIISFAANSNAYTTVFTGAAAGLTLLAAKAALLNASTSGSPLGLAIIGLTAFVAIIGAVANQVQSANTAMANKSARVLSAFEKNPNDVNQKSKALASLSDRYTTFDKFVSQDDLTDKERNVMSKMKTNRKLLKEYYGMDPEVQKTYPTFEAFYNKVSTKGFYDNVAFQKLADYYNEFQTAFNTSDPYNKTNNTSKMANFRMLLQESNLDPEDMEVLNSLSAKAARGGSSTPAVKAKITQALLIKAKEAGIDISPKRVVNTRQNDIANSLGIATNINGIVGKKSYRMSTVDEEYLKLSAKDRARVDAMAKGILSPLADGVPVDANYGNSVKATRPGFTPIIPDTTIVEIGIMNAQNYLDKRSSYFDSLDGYGLGALNKISGVKETSLIQATIARREAALAIESIKSQQLTQDGALTGISSDMIVGDTASSETEAMFRKLPKSHQDAIVDAAKKAGIPVAVLKGLIRRESGFNATANRPGSQFYGYGQLGKSAAAEVGADRFNPIQNIYGTANYLGSKYKKSKGNIAEALMRYQSGDGNFEKRGTQFRDGLGTRTLDYANEILGYAGTGTGSGEDTLKIVQQAKNFATRMANEIAKVNKELSAKLSKIKYSEVEKVRSLQQGLSEYVSQQNLALGNYSAQSSYVDAAGLINNNRNLIPSSQNLQIFDLDTKTELDSIKREQYAIADRMSVDANGNIDQGMQLYYRGLIDSGNFQNFQAKDADTLIQLQQKSDLYKKSRSAQRSGFGMSMGAVIGEAMQKFGGNKEAFARKEFDYYMSTRGPLSINDITDVTNRQTEVARYKLKNEQDGAFASGDLTLAKAIQLQIDALDRNTQSLIVANNNTTRLYSLNLRNARQAFTNAKPLSPIDLLNQRVSDDVDAFNTLDSDAQIRKLVKMGVNPLRAYTLTAAQRSAQYETIKLRQATPEMRAAENKTALRSAGLAALNAVMSKGDVITAFSDSLGGSSMFSSGNMLERIMANVYTGDIKKGITARGQKTGDYAGLGASYLVNQLLDPANTYSNEGSTLGGFAAGMGAFAGLGAFAGPAGIIGGGLLGSLFRRGNKKDPNAEAYSRFITDILSKIESNTRPVGDYYRTRANAWNADSAHLSGRALSFGFTRGE